MTGAEKKEMALKFLYSARGQYIMSQALYLAIAKLQSVQPEHMQERSNIEHMQLLLQELFPLYGLVAGYEDSRTPSQEEGG
jgi:hypothetical protein